MSLFPKSVKRHESRMKFMRLLKDWLALTEVLTDAHKIPLPALVPFAESERMPPGCPEPPIVTLWDSTGTSEAIP